MKTLQQHTDEIEQELIASRPVPCKTCNKLMLEAIDILFVSKFGECSACDHVRGEQYD